MKTKVVAFRLTQSQFEELDWLANVEDMTVAELVRHLALEHYNDAMFEARLAIVKERKKAEAKAKRDAKKAAANGLQ